MGELAERVSARMRWVGGRCAERYLVSGTPVLPVAPMMRMVGAILGEGSLG